MSWLAHFVTKHPKLIIAVFSLITLVGIVGASRIEFVYTFRSVYDYPGNEKVALQDRYMDDFGDDGGFVAAIVEADDVFTAPVLTFIQDISRQLKRKPVYRRVWSLSVNQIPRGRGDEVITGPLFEQVPTDPAKLRQIREVALSSSLAVPRLVSKDGRYALIAAELRTPSVRATMKEQKVAIDTMWEVLGSVTKPDGIKIQVAGNPIIENEIRNTMVNEQLLFGSVAMALITLVLIVAFGTFHGVIGPFSEVLLTVIWIAGIMGFAGFEINVISNTAPTILMIYGLLDSLFIVSMFYKALDETDDRIVAVQTTIKRMGWPCLITSASTAIGFAGFAMTKIPVMQKYGIILSVGVLLAFVTSVIWLPALLCVLPTPRRGYKRRLLFKWINVMLGRVGLFTTRWRVPIFATAIVLLVSVVLIGAKFSRTSVYYLKELPQDTPGMKGLQLLADHMVGSIATAVMVTGKADSMQDPKVIKALDELDRWAEKQSIVRSSLSPADIVRELHRAFNGGDPKFAKVPDDRSLIEQYLSMLDPNTRSDFITEDYARTHLRILSVDVGSWRWRHELMDPLRKRANELLGDSFKLDFTGYAPAGYNGLEELVEQMLKGFVFGFLAIALLVAIAFRSVRLAVLAIMPNLLPTAFCLATLAIAGVTLRTGTTLFLCVAVGITFDNTIHLFSHVRDARRRGLPHEAAITECLGSVGPPIIYTSLMIAAGFGIFVLSDFELLQAFGLTCVGVVVAATFADLLVTVALVRLVGKRALAPRGGATDGANNGATDGARSES